MEGEYTPAIIRLILLTDLALIQLKDSLFNSLFSQQVFGLCKCNFFWHRKPVGTDKNN